MPRPRQLNVLQQEINASSAHEVLVDLDSGVLERVVEGSPVRGRGLVPLARSCTRQTDERISIASQN